MTETLSAAKLSVGESHCAYLAVRALTVVALGFLDVDTVPARALAVSRRRCGRSEMLVR